LIHICSAADNRDPKEGKQDFGALKHSAYRADAEDTMRTPQCAGRRDDIVEYEALTDDDSWHDVKVLIRESARCLVTYEVEEAASGTSEQKYHVWAIQLPLTMQGSLPKSRCWRRRDLLRRGGGGRGKRRGKTDRRTGSV